MDTPRLRTNLLGASSIDIGRNYLDSVIIEKFIKEVDATDSKELFNYAHFLTNYWYSKFARWYGMKNVAQSITPNDLKDLMSNIDTTIIDVVNLSRLRVNILLSSKLSFKKCLRGVDITMIEQYHVQTDYFE